MDLNLSNISPNSSFHALTLADVGESLCSPKELLSDGNMSHANGTESGDGALGRSCCGGQEELSEMNEPLAPL